MHRHDHGIADVDDPLLYAIGLGSSCHRRLPARALVLRNAAAVLAIPEGLDEELEEELVAGSAVDGAIVFIVNRFLSDNRQEIRRAILPVPANRIGRDVGSLHRRAE